jgi:hypothetical protein
VADHRDGDQWIYRFVVPFRMPNVVAGALARSILKAKSRLMAATPLANQIEAPDPDNENPLFPIHAGVAAFLSSGDQSFFDQFQQYFYYIDIPLSIMASMAAIVTGFEKQEAGRGSAADFPASGDRR